jgi:hypothetical protein
MAIPYSIDGTGDHLEFTDRRARLHRPNTELQIKGRSAERVFATTFEALS